MTTPINGLSSVIDQYDGFVIDAWGVLHDGATLYPHVTDCLTQLMAANKQVAILSNSPSPIASLQQKLASHFGLHQGTHYHAIMNSGHSAFVALRDRSDDFHAQLGPRYHLIGLDIHSKNLTDLPYYHAVDDYRDADFLFITRTLDSNETISDYDPILRYAAEKNMPLICGNPDRTVGHGGHLYQCAGMLADRYTELGGTNLYFHGKPYAPIYHSTLDLIGRPPRILAIGDGMPTDIKGGYDFGIDTILITTGIHREFLFDDGIARNEAPADRLAALTAQYNATPTYSLSDLRW